MRPTPGLSVAVIVLFLCGCTGEPREPSPLRLAGPEAAADRIAGAGAPAESQTSASAEQRLIRSAELDIEVQSMERALEEIEAAAKAQGGLIAGLEVRRDDRGNRSGRLTVRVPATRFEDALRRLKQVGRVQRESVATQDVTKAYADLETRLGVKRQTEERLRQLIASRAGKLAEVLEVERELDRVVGEIEQLLGEKRYYDHRIAMSDVVVALHEPGAVMRPGLTDPIRMALRRSLEVLSTSVAALVYIVVFLVPWLLVATILWRIAAVVRRRSRGPGS